MVAKQEIINANEATKNIKKILIIVAVFIAICSIGFIRNYLEDVKYYKECKNKEYLEELVTSAKNSVNDSRSITLLFVGMEIILISGIVICNKKIKKNSSLLNEIITNEQNGFDECGSTIVSVADANNIHQSVTDNQVGNNSNLTGQEYSASKVYYDMSGVKAGNVYNKTPKKTSVWTYVGIAIIIICGCIVLDAIKKYGALNNAETSEDDITASESKESNITASESKESNVTVLDSSIPNGAYFDIDYKDFADKYNYYVFSADLRSVGIDAGSSKYKKIKKNSAGYDIYKYTFGVSTPSFSIELAVYNGKVVEVGYVDYTHKNNDLLLERFFSALDCLGIALSEDKFPLLTDGNEFLKDQNVFLGLYAGEDPYFIISACSEEVYNKLK